MKKVKFDRKLSLKKETISNLQNSEMNSIKGGITAVSCLTCGVSFPHCSYDCPVSETNDGTARVCCQATVCQCPCGTADC